VKIKGWEKGRWGKEVVLRVGKGGVLRLGKRRGRVKGGVKGAVLEVGKGGRVRGGGKGD
jgi:hypothetical protein